MGGSTSKTRKLTVENDDPTSVIKVSDDVVDRIRGVAQSKNLNLNYCFVAFYNKCINKNWYVL